ncbi:MAG: hypothetical protein RLZ97_2648 [Verrucomicrobiota bacterium]
MPSGTFACSFLLDIIAMLSNKLRGVWNCYGVIGYPERKGPFAWFAQRLVYTWLNRRSFLFS